MILYVMSCIVMYINYSMYIVSALGRGGQGCFGNGEMHESMRFLGFC